MFFNLHGYYAHVNTLIEAQRGVSGGVMDPLALSTVNQLTQQ